MKKLEQQALARLPLSYAEVEKIWSRATAGGQEWQLCQSHERLRMESQGLQTVMRGEQFGCYESDRAVKTVIYDPAGNDVTVGALLDLLNGYAAEVVALRERVNELENLP